MRVAGSWKSPHHWILFLKIKLKNSRIRQVNYVELPFRIRIVDLVQFFCHPNPLFFGLSSFFFLFFFFTPKIFYEFMYHWGSWELHRKEERSVITLQPIWRFDRDRNVRIIICELVENCFGTKRKRSTKMSCYKKKMNTFWYVYFSPALILLRLKIFMRGNLCGVVSRDTS